MKSQISKDFTLKSKLRKLADGGAVKPEMLGSGMAAGAGRVLAGRRTSIDAQLDAAMGGAPRPAPAPAPAPAPETKSGLRGLFGLADGGERLGAEYENTKYQQSALRDGGHVEGPGGPTDDKVGPVMLSDEEYVLPGDTADAIGRDKLDALRAATHDFKDPEKEEELLEGMDALADGGSPWSVDGRGNVNTGAPNRSPALRTPPQGALRPVPQPIPQRPPVDITPPGSRGAAPVQMANEITDVKPKTTATRVGSALRKAVTGGAAPALAGLGGVYQSYDDSQTGYRDEFAKSVGAESPLGMVAADTARTLANVGDTALFGLPGRVGRGIAGALGGGGFVDGLMSDSERDKFVERQAAGSQTMSPARKAPVVEGPADGAGGTYQSSRLNQMGVSDAVQGGPVVPGSREVLRSGGTSEFQNLGGYGGDANIYGRASDPSKPGRMNDFAGVGATARPASGAEAPRGSNSGDMLRSALRGQPAAAAAPSGPQGFIPDDTDKRFDKMERDLRGMYSAKGQGNLAKKLLQLEEMRQGARSSLRNDSTSRANNTATNDTSRGNAELSARTQMMDALSRSESNSADVAARTSAAQAKAVADAQAAYAASEEKGNERYNKALDSMFTVAGPDGKQTVDKAMQEQFRNYIQSSDLQVGGKKFSAMSPQEQMVNMQEALQQFQIGNAVNETAASGSMLSNTGGVTNSFNPVTSVGEAELTDWTRGNMPFSDYIGAKINPFTTNRVVRTQSGQSALYDDVVNDGNGTRNLDRERAIKSSLRGN